MAFCMYCGKPIEEGGACNCPQSLQEKGADTSIRTNDMDTVTSTEGATNINHMNHQGPLGVNSAYDQEQLGINPTYNQGQPRVNLAYNQGQPEVNPAYDQGKPGVNPAYDQGKPGVNPAYNQEPPEVDPTYNQNNIQFEQMKEKSGAFLKDTFGAWISILKAPATAGKQMIQANNFVAGIGLIVFQALLTGIFGILVCSTLNDVLSIGSYFSSSGIMSINLFLAFLLTVIGSLLMSVARVGLLLGGIKIFTGTANWQKMVCICGVRAVGVSFIQIVSIVVYFLNPYYGIELFIFASIVGFTFVLPRVLEHSGVSNDKGIYMVIGITIILFVVLYILYSIGLPMYAPKEMKNGLKNISDILGYFY